MPLLHMGLQEGCLLMHACNRPSYVGVVVSIHVRSPVMLHAFMSVLSVKTMEKVEENTFIW